MDAQNLQDQLFGFLKANPTQAYPAQTLADGLRLDDANAFTKVVQALAALERGGKVKVNEEGAFQYDAEKEGIIGVFKSNDKGFGFVHYDDKEEDVFINPDNTMFAVQGDEVRVKLLTKGDANTGRGPEGKVAEIITHAREHVVGEFTLGSEYKGYVGSIRLTDKKFASFEFLVKEGGASATDGEVVVASIDQYPSAVAPKRFTGAITEKVGYKDDPGVDILQIVYNHDVPHVFPEAVLEQANKIPDDVQDFEREGREDITDQPLVTIDAIESKDLDDAVVVWKLDRLGRSVQDLVTLVDGFRRKQVQFISLTESIDTTTTGGILVFNIFASLAQFERDLIVERTNAGLVAARARGRKGGRPRKLTPGKIKKIRELYGQGDLSVGQIGKLYGVSRTTIYRLLSRKG